MQINLKDENSLLVELRSFVDQPEYNNLSSKYLLLFIGEKSKKLFNPSIKDTVLSEVPAETLCQIWKSLIIDAINFLRINDARERSFLNGSGEKTSTLDTTNTNTLNAYGVEELYSYFEQFTDFELILYGADRSYRDHIQHPLFVWLIGMKILIDSVDHFLFRVAGENLVKVKVNDSATREYFEGKYKIPLIVSSAEIGAMWAIVALTHDLGYPLQKVDRINAQLQKMLEKFGHIDFKASEFSIGHQHSYLVKHLLSLLSSSLELKEKERFWVREKNVFFTHIRSKYYAKFSKSWEVFDHGIVSSLILLRSLTYFLEADLTMADGKFLNEEDARQYTIRAEMLHAIAAHTTPKVYHILSNNLAFLLLLCDDLHELNRPTMSDIRTHTQSGAEDVAIDELNISLKESKIECSLIYPVCDIPLQEKRALRAFKTWYERLRPAVDDKQRKMSFIWKMYFGTSEWRFDFNSERDVFNELKVTNPNNEPIDIYETSKNINQ